MKALRTYYSFFLRLLFVVSLCCLFCTGEKDQSKAPDQSLPELDFSYNNAWTTAFSVKTSSRDTIYLKQHFSGEGERVSPGMYYVLASQEIKDTLRHHVDQIRFSHLDTLYDENIRDGEMFKVCTRLQGRSHCILVNSEHVPLELKRLAYFLVKTKENWICQELDTTVYFASDLQVVTPKVNINQFLPPE